MRNGVGRVDGTLAPVAARASHSNGDDCEDYEGRSKPPHPATSSSHAFLAADPCALKRIGMLDHPAGRHVEEKTEEED